MKMLGLGIYGFGMDKRLIRVGKFGYRSSVGGPE